MKNTHPKVLQYLTSVTIQIKLKEARLGVRRELLDHIEDHIQTALSYGIDDERAIAESLKRMGDPLEIGAALDTVHRTKVDLFIVGLVAALCAMGLYVIHPAGWTGPQILWMAIGTTFAVIAYYLPYGALTKCLTAFYPLAVGGLIAAQFSGISFEGQPYLSVFGSKIKIVDFAACMMVAGLPAVIEIFHKKAMRHFVLLILVIGPISYFSAIGSIFPATLVLIGTLVMTGPLKMSHWISLAIGTLGTLLISISAGTSFLSAAQLKDAIREEEGHTDFALATLVQNSQIGAALVVAFFALFLIHLVLRTGGIKTPWLKATTRGCVSLFAVEILFGLTSNYGLAPMFKTGINIPFLSYGGSLMVVHILMVGIILACLRRKSVLYHRELLPSS